MKRFFERYGRLLLYIPIPAILGLIGFVIGEWRATRRGSNGASHEVSYPMVLRPAPVVPPQVTPETRQPPAAEEKPARPQTVRPLAWAGVLVLVIPFAIALAAIIVNSRNQLNTIAVEPVQGGNPGNARAEITAYGCGSCHTIEGIPGALGKVGPRLDEKPGQA